MQGHNAYTLQEQLVRGDMWSVIVTKLKANEGWVLRKSCP